MRQRVKWGGIRDVYWWEKRSRHDWEQTFFSSPAWERNALPSYLFAFGWFKHTHVISMPGHGGQYSNGQTYPQCNWCSYWYAIATRRGLTICFPIWALREGITRYVHRPAFHNLSMKMSVFVAEKMRHTRLAARHPWWRKYHGHSSRDFHSRLVY